MAEILQLQRKTLSNQLINQLKSVGDMIVQLNRINKSSVLF